MAQRFSASPLAPPRVPPQGTLVRARWLEPLPEAVTWIAVRDAMGGEGAGLLRVDVNRVRMQGGRICVNWFGAPLVRF